MKFENQNTRVDSTPALGNFFNEHVKTNTNILNQQKLNSNNKL